MAARTARPERTTEERQELIGAGFGLARWIARRFAGRRGEPFRQDLEQESFVAVLHAARLYDPEIGSWQAYVVASVRNQLRIELNQWRSPVRIPLDSWYRKIPIPRKADPVRNHDGDETDLVDLLPSRTMPPDIGAYQIEIAGRVRAAVAKLPIAERCVLHVRYLGSRPYTMRETGDRMGWWPDKVCRVEHLALARLRESETLRDFA